MIIRGCNIILPPVWSGVYYNTARLLKYSLEDNGIKSDIRETDDNGNSDLSIVLGWNLIPENTRLRQPYILYQLEPLCLEHWRAKLNSRFFFFKNASTIWDYSSQNKKYLEEFGLDSKTLLIGYHPKLQETEHSENTDYDVLFIGFLTERRQRILEELSNYCCVSVQPRWGSDFGDALSRSKILLNIHQYEIPMPLEQPRIAYAINNSCFVLSEESIDHPYDNLSTFNYKDLKNGVLHYLHHSRLRKEKKRLVSDLFKFLPMKELIGDTLKDMILEIN